MARDFPREKKGFIFFSFAITFPGYGCNHIKEKQSRFDDDYDFPSCLLS